MASDAQHRREGSFHLARELAHPATRARYERNGFQLNGSRIMLALESDLMRDVYARLDGPGTIAVYWPETKRLELATLLGPPTGVREQADLSPDGTHVEVHAKTTIGMYFDIVTATGASWSVFTSSWNTPVRFSPRALSV
ncbi:hypothetical protein [Streptomyces sp. NPDC048584]|uniref:hypothetical protein n=1 Tax=Streptomyces sp. NPDC048584 TaxID=3365573 RepID=UPI003711F73E